MASVLVQNISGTSDNPPPRGYDSWLEFWADKRETRPFLCRRCGSLDSDLVGAHVMKVYGGNEWYIVPLCTRCNLTSGNFYVPEEDLVPVR